MMLKLVKKLAQQDEFSGMLIRGDKPKEEQKRAKKNPVRKQKTKGMRPENRTLLPALA